MAGKAIPTSLKLIRGNPGKKAINRKEPKPPAGIPDIPPVLGAVGQGEWQRIAPLLLKMGLLTELDMAALMAYCLAFEELVESTKTLNEEGRQKTTNANGLVNHPAKVRQKDAFTTLRQYLVEFGLSPSSRAKLSVETQPVDEFDDFLRQKA